MSGPAYDLVTTRLAEVTGYRPANEHGDWRCPSHDDRNPSLTVTNGAGKVLVCCQAARQCDIDDIAAALGLKSSDFYDEPWQREDKPGARRVVATYPYTDERGELLFEVLRYDPKGFRQRRPAEGGGWEWKLGDVRRVLYRLPQVIEAKARGEAIWVAEGEKDVEALERAGRVATCSPGGARKWRPEYAEVLADAPEVVVVADNDVDGVKHAADVEASLIGKVGRLVVVKALTGKDAADHLGAGHTLDEFALVSEWIAPPPPAVRAVAGGAFILDAPATPPVVWGRGGAIAWAGGEPLMINGPTGVGKTTIAQQVVLGRLGLRSQVLDLPVEPEERKLLYIAADRPSQAARSFARMVTEEDRQVLDERLVVWRGPLPFSLAKEPARLASFAEELGAGTIVVDSLKDVIAKPSDEETANLANNAFQECTATGLELMVLHHQRKGQGDNKKPTTIDDVYGSIWLTAGMGSVVLIWGQPGDILVELSHLKQPAEPVGPWKLLHDHDAGLTVVQGAVDLLVLVRTSNGLTAEGAARAMFETDKPKPNELEKARRQLEKLVAKGLAHPEPGGRSAVEGRQLPTRYYGVETRS